MSANNHACPRCGSSNASGKKSDLPPEAGGGRSTYYEFRCGDCELFEDHVDTETDFRQWLARWSGATAALSSLRALLGVTTARLASDRDTGGRVQIYTASGDQHAFDLVNTLPGDVRAVVIVDPREGTREFCGERMAELRRWARILEVENALANPDDNDRFVRVVRAFDYYCVFEYAATLLGGPVSYGPDLSREGHFVTVCTAPDAVEAYLASGNPPDVAQTRVLHMRGELLFAQLRERAHELGIDGMLFNPCGPPASAMFLAGVLQLL